MTVCLGTSFFEHALPSHFANSIDECDTLIVYSGFESGRNVNYYSNGADRVSITTIVLVIDAKARELQHIEIIGTDSPSSVTDMSHTTGRLKDKEAEQYIASLVE